MKNFTTQIFSLNLNINHKTMLILPPLYEFNEFDTSLAKVISDLDPDTFYSLDFYMFSGHKSDYIDSELLLPKSDSNDSLLVKNTELLNYIEARVLTKGYMKVNTFVFAHQYLESIEEFVDDIYNELDTNISETYYASKEPASDENIDTILMDGNRYTVLTIKREAVI
jgi:hypothetical protein